MNSETPRLIFALSCLVGFVVIAGAALYEIGRQRRGEGVIKPLHFRCRMASASIWMTILLSLGYGVAFEWPQNKDDIEAIRNLQNIFGGATLLIMIAGLLFTVDLWFTMRMRAHYMRRGSRDINKFAQDEIAQLRKAEKKQSGGEG